MPRYLTPARVCLLVLVQIYLEGNRISSEATLDVLEFLASQVVSTTATEHDENVVRKHLNIASTDIRSFGNVLHKLSSTQPGRFVYDVLLSALWKLQGHDSLNDLVDALRAELPGNDRTSDRPVSVTPASPIGQFIRRCYVEYTRLQFAECLSLWNAFVQYRESSYDEWSIRHPEAAARLSNIDPERDILPQARTLTTNDDPKMAAVDADMLVNFFISRLQSMGARVPQDLKPAINDWVVGVSEAGSQPLHHFVAFFEHWRAGQYTMALEALHRHFDYSVGKADKDGSEKLRSHYQYALLHLSILHADFECWQESIEAMNECIVSARETGDTQCLYFALSWLLYFRQAHAASGQSKMSGSMSQILVSGSSEADEIAFLKHRAREARHWGMLSTALLEEAKLNIHNGTNIVRAQDHVIQAAHLEVQHNLRSLLSASALYQGAIYDRIGQVHLANQIYESSDFVDPSHRPLSDKARLSCRVARGLTQAGLFDQAESMLKSLASAATGILKLQQRAGAFLTVTMARKALHRHDVPAASYHLSQLKPLSTSNDPELVADIRILEIELLLKQQQYEAALTLVNKRLAVLTGPNIDLAQRLQMLLIKNKIFTAGGQSSQGFSIALRATAIAHRHCIIPLFLDGLAALSRILLDLSEFEAVKDITSALLPQALEFDQAHLTAGLYVSLAEAHVGIAGHHCEHEPGLQAKNMRIAEDLIEKGYEYYNHIKDLDGMLECLVMKSRIATWAGNDVAAQRADDMYVQLMNDAAEEQDQRS